MIKESNAGDQLHLGRQFLSAAYVMLNEDTSSFTLWKVNPTAHQYLVAVDKNNTPLLSNCSANMPSGPNGESGSKISPGAIAGIAVAVISALIIIALVAFFTSRRNDKVRAWLNQPVVDQADPKTGPVDVPLQNLSSSELDVPYSAPPPEEMGTENEIRDLVELPGSSSLSDLKLK
jgi:hypothetical protein